MILLPLLAVAILVAAWWTLRTTPFVSDAAPAGVRGSTSPTGADASRLLRLEEAFGRIESTLASLAAAPRADAPAPERALPPPPTLPSVLQSESLRPVVLGMAKGIDAMGAYRFVRSLRDHSPGAECVIFTDEASLAAEASLREIYDAFGVTVVIFDLARDVPPSAVAWHPSSYRWLLMRDWLRAEADASRLHGSVFFADVRDTIFQGDVFAVAAETPSAGRAFYAFQEQRPMTIAQCGWNSGWVKDCFGVDGLAKVGGNIISCSGTSLASWENARAYADLMGAPLALTRTRGASRQIQILTLPPSFLPRNSQPTHYSQIPGASATASTRACTITSSILATSLRASLSSY